MAETFAHHRPAALALLSSVPALSHKEGGFLGHVVVAPDISVRQRAWLVKLLNRHALPPLVVGE